MLIALLIIAILMVFYFTVLRGPGAQEELDTVHGEWVARMFRDDEAKAHFAEERFPYTLAEYRDLQKANLAEIEDEAASYALFLLYSHLDNATSESLISVFHPLFGTFHFSPDYEDGHVVGVVDAFAVNKVGEKHTSKIGAEERIR